MNLEFNSAKLTVQTSAPVVQTTKNVAKKAISQSAKIGGAVLMNAVLFGAPLVISAIAGAEHLKALYDASETTNPKENTVSTMLKTAKNRTLSNKSINKTPDSRHDPETMINYLCDRHGPEAVRNTLENLMDSDPTEGDVRFNNTNNNKFQFDSSELLAKLDEYESRGSSAESTGTSPTMFSKTSTDEPEEAPAVMSQTASIKKDITDELVAFVKRQPTEVQVGNSGAKIVQEYGHIAHSDGEAVFKEGTTPSAELSNAKKMDNVANQASITYVDKKGDKSVVMCRSGRTDSANKIRDKSLGDINARLNASNGKGDNCLRETVDQDGNSYFEYRRVDNTLMDTSILKSAYTAANSFLTNLGREKPVESERMFVDNKNDAIRKTWKAGKTGAPPYIEHQISHGNKTVTVREYPPIVNQYVFSGQSNSVTNLRNAREANRASTLEMGRIFAQEDLQLHSGLQQKFQDCLDNPNSTKKLKALTDELKNITYPDPETNMIIDGIYASLTGFDRTTGKSIDTVAGAAQQYMYASMLADAIGLAFGAECKSGNDRTATAMAIKCAQKEYQEVYGKPFNPKSEGPELQRFKELFVKYIISLAEPNVAASRGAKAENDDKPVLKTGSHPVFGYLAKEDSSDKNSPWIKVDIPGHPGKVDVTDFMKL